MEPLYSLTRWAKHLGISPPTLKGWLLAAGIFLPDVVRGSKYLIPKSDIDRAIRRRLPQTNLARLRVLRETVRNRRQQQGTEAVA